MIKIYGTRGCGYCTQAVKECRKYGKPYQYYDAGITMYYKELVAAGCDTRTMPHIFANGNYIGNLNNLKKHLRIPSGVL